MAIRPLSDFDLAVLIASLPVAFSFDCFVAVEVSGLSANLTAIEALLYTSFPTYLVRSVTSDKLSELMS